MNKYHYFIATLVLSALAPLADKFENSSKPLIGSLLWAAIMLGGAFVLIKLADKVKKSPMIAIVALIPFFGLLLTPAAALVYLLLPEKKK